MLLTFQDGVERLIDYLGAQAGDTVLIDCKKACIEALRDLAQAYTWTYLYRHGRLNLDASYGEGTIRYQAQNGQAPFLATLTGGTWPSWAAQGTLRIGDINYDVEHRLGDALITLVPSQAPPQDLDDGTEYGLFHDTYSLPHDFASQDVTFIPNNFGGLTYVHPREWLLNTASRGVLSDPAMFTIFGDQDRGGRYAIRLAPFPTNADTIEFLYKGLPRAMGVFRETAGKISVPSGINVWQGTGTAFSPLMEGGCVLRISADPKKLPTAEWGDNPAVFESKVVKVFGPAALQTWDAAPAAYSLAPFTISSFVDISTGAMEQAYLRCCEMHISMSRIMKDKPSARAQYLEALELAKCADSRNMFPRAAGPPAGARRRLRDFPINLTREV